MKSKRYKKRRSSLGVKNLILFFLSVGISFWVLNIGAGLLTKNEGLDNQKILGLNFKEFGITSKNTMKKPEDYLKFKEELTQYLDLQTGTYGVYVYDLSTNYSYGINEDLRFPAASTSKIHILIALYQDIEKGIINPEEKVIYLEEDYEEGTGGIQYKDFNTHYTVRDLAYKMIKNSDNVAKNMLLRKLGRGRIITFLESQNVPSIEFVMNSQASPKDMGKILLKLYKGDLVSEESKEEIIRILTGSDFENRLPKNLTGVPVAHKIGTWEGAISDVGIVMGEKPFIICVYSNGIKSVPVAEGVIAYIAQMVYEFESS
jgi:beta-lactamase class A